MLSGSRLSTVSICLILMSVRKGKIESKTKKGQQKEMGNAQRFWLFILYPSLILIESILPSNVLHTKSGKIELRIPTFEGWFWPRPHQKHPESASESSPESSASSTKEKRLRVRRLEEPQEGRNVCNPKLIVKLTLKMAESVCAFDEE